MRTPMSRRAVAALTALFCAAAGWAAALAPAQAQAEEALLSHQRPASASSEESPDYTPASAAFDGDPGTRWSSQFSDDEWIQVDLGGQFDLTRVELVWEAAYATAYEIQVSADGSAWTTAYAESSGGGGSESIGLDATGRYVRMQGLDRVGGYGYSLWSFDVYGCAAGGGSEVPDGPAEVEVVGSQGNWRLTVNDEPFTIKGLTWGPSPPRPPRSCPRSPRWA
nr:hypothetical protein GCM10025732_55450 [Glycomyces mayteni]